LLKNNDNTSFFFENNQDRGDTRSGLLQQNLRLFSDRNLNKTLLLSETIRFMETKVFLPAQGQTNPYISDVGK